MKLLELFAGSRSIGVQAEALGFDVFSVDWKPFDGIDLVADIEFLRLEDIPFVPDIIWASFDCTTYSISSISHHRDGQMPKSEYAKKSDIVNQNALLLIAGFLKLNPELKFYIENPVGMLRKMDFMKGIPRATVTYCRYGDTRMKPTDIFTNNLYSLFNPYGWNPRPRCSNGDKCHISAPRGSKTGTQGLKNSFERSKVPEELCLEIINTHIRTMKLTA